MNEDQQKEDQQKSFDLFSAEYSALRDEICQSIGLQHRILLTGYAATAAIFGYVAAMKPPFWPALICIPFILLAMTSLWAVECNRMVRASSYIQTVLWPALRIIALVPESSAVGWEAWIRSTEKSPGGFSRRQDHSQRFVVSFVPLAITIICVIASSYSAWGTDIRLAWVVIATGVLAFGLWIPTVIRVRGVSNLQLT